MNFLFFAYVQVSMFSPAAKAGLTSGNTILVINDWQIEAMDQPQVCLEVMNQPQVFIKTMDKLQVCLEVLNQP